MSNSQLEQLKINAHNENENMSEAITTAYPLGLAKYFNDDFVATNVCRRNLTPGASSGVLA